MDTSAVAQAMGRLHAATVRLAQANITTQATVALTSLGVALAIGTCATTSAETTALPPQDSLSLEPHLQGLKLEVSRLRRTLDDGFRDEPAEPAPSELLAEIQQLRIALAVAEHSSKAAWEARTKDWKAFEAQRAATKLALAETAKITRTAHGTTLTPVDSPERKQSDSDHHNQAHAIALEHKESPPGIGPTNTAVTAEQLNLVIREILAPVPVIVQGVLSPRDAGELLDRPTKVACKTGSVASTSSKSPSEQLRGKRRSRNWSRHKKGPWNVGDAAAASTGTPDCRSPRLQALGERQTATAA